MNRAPYLLVVGLVACGAKTGLPEPSEDAALDALDAPNSPDIFDMSDMADAMDAADVLECIPFQTTAELASLDIFLLVDSSGSMGELTATGVTKSEAVTDALDDFLGSRESAGVGAALTFFPSINDAVPEFCRGDSDCGAGGSCLAPDVCSESGLLCEEGSECPLGEGECVPLGRCTASEDVAFCFPDVLDPRNDFCAESGLGVCIDLGLCENRISCDPGVYERPNVPIDELPGAGAALVEALVSRAPEGGTPTLPAVRGVLEAARARSVLRPGNKIVMLVATDGFPADCDENLPSVFERDPDPTAGIVEPAEVLAAGDADGIQSFVIGVFEPEQEREARENLSRLAEAGGTEEALIVTTDEDVSGRLFELLTELRREVRSCVYAIPAAGAVPDPRDLQVRLLVPSSPPVELLRVEREEDCADVEFGFFFQQDIEDGARPGFAELCPVPCDIASAPEVEVEMQAGCR
ncbi:MAG: hypothetical protein AAF938_21365 [Myxococcota bacterium]